MQMTKIFDTNFLKNKWRIFVSFVSFCSNILGLAGSQIMAARWLNGVVRGAKAVLKPPHSKAVELAARVWTELAQEIACIEPFPGKSSPP
jgi:hypothetical protein